MNYLSRSAAGLRSPRSRTRISRSSGIYVHHTAGPTSQTPAQIQSFHMNTRGWVDIAYSWLVDHTGRITEGRGWGVQGAHTAGFNSTSHAVCYIGNTSVKAAPPVAKAAINTVIAEHNRRYGPGYVRPHNAVAATACPGTDLTAWVNRGRPGGTGGCKAEGLRRGDNNYIVAGLQKSLNKAGQTLSVDGDFGPRTERAVTNFNKYFKIGAPACYPVAQAATIKMLDFINAKPAPTPPAPKPAPVPPPKVEPVPPVAVSHEKLLSRLIAVLNKVLQRIKKNPGTEYDPDWLKDAENEA